ncbi:HIT family hydrolase, diadenosine tetraphosphate hydrolase [Caldisphaera lagunensis DSM 15908]|uniref:HIT family hydrolase, diadenosine tetraphosphate hydrolase n=1 Tax=Caldisphaera lagunensis (strain DSM 15908 / JCM 11604 / ANMR 0165 / IC-154) TaxID=1056495 RepID=L0A9N1_CALLD|nr:HIT family protein [Caldisphaera lagunensis]AFZ69852.1 HIT family hydrolase, diadenosine tetraphosphate hydrolase [Caldisphaera lagunensis DSM 15908]
MEDVFCRIAKGEEKSYTVYSDDKIMVIMDIYPMSKGQTLVIPKKHFVFFYEMPDDLIYSFYKTVNIIGKAMIKAFNPKAIALIARGLRVPHYHLILVPIRDGDINDKYFSVMDAYQGFPKVSSDVLLARIEDFKSLAMKGRPQVSEDELIDDMNKLKISLKEIQNT